MDNLREITLSFTDYLEAENDQIARTYQGYKDVELYIGPTLADAWLKARPDEGSKFEVTV